MSEAELYEDLTRQDRRYLPLRFGKEFAGRSPDNPVFQEFGEYITRQKNLHELDINWDNTCAEVTLTELWNGICKNDKNKIHEIEVKDDLRPLDTIMNFDFVGLVAAIGRRTPSGTIVKLGFGHNNYGESWWFELKSSSGHVLIFSDIVFPNARVCESTLLDLLDQVADDGVKELSLSLDRITRYISYGGLQRMSNVLSTKMESLSKFYLRMTPQDNDYLIDEQIWKDKENGGTKFPYDLVVQAIAGLVNDNPGLEKIEVSLGFLSAECSVASLELDKAIKHNPSLRMKKNVKLDCWCKKYLPWTALPKKDWDTDVESEEEGDY